MVTTSVLASADAQSGLSLLLVGCGPGRGILFRPQVAKVISVESTLVDEMNTFTTPCVFSCFFLFPAPVYFLLLQSASVPTLHHHLI